MAGLTLDQDVCAALMALMGTIKPIHDKYFAYAAAADNQELAQFVKYIRKRSHEKGAQWKGLLFFLNDYVTITSIPPTDAYPVNVAMAVPDILNCMLADETAIRLAIEDVIALARLTNENRVIQFLGDYVESQTKAESKIDRLCTYWQTVNGDPYEWESKL